MSRKKYKGPFLGPFFFNINKPVDMSSFDVIRHFKRQFPFSIGKIGHFGTLDPFANGVLLVGIGPSTKLNNWTQNFPKTYVAEGELGVKSPTGDCTAPAESYEKDVSFSLSIEADIKKELESFKGIYEQVPHAYSATKHEGKNLYEWAREGIEIKKDPVSREIYDIKLIETDGTFVKFEVTVSSGTYIRVLFEDLAKKLDTFGMLNSLTRTSIGPHSIDNALPQSFWPESREDGLEFIETKALSIKNLIDLKTLDIDESKLKLALNGNEFAVDTDDGEYWLNHEDQILSLCEVKNKSLTHSVVFNPPGKSKADSNVLYQK